MKRLCPVKLHARGIAVTYQRLLCVAGAKLRRDLMGHGSVGALDLNAAKSQHSGLAEQFAFARAVSRLFELTQNSL